MKRGVITLGCCILGFGIFAAPVSANDAIEIIAYKASSMPGIVLSADEMHRLESGDLPAPKMMSVDDLPQTPVPVVSEKGVMLVIKHDGANIILMSASVKTTRKRAGGEIPCEVIATTQPEEREEQGVMSAGESACQK